MTLSGRCGIIKCPRTSIKTYKVYRSGIGYFWYCQIHYREMRRGVSKNR